MKLLKIGPASAIVALVFGTAAFAGAPDGPFGSNSHPAADFIWSYDGTRDNLTVNLQHLLGGEKNPFGPLEGGPEGVVPEGSELLADYVPHILGIPGPEIRLPNDQYFYSGAEPHNATREAAIITKGRAGEILALAILGTNYDKRSAVKVLTIITGGEAIDPTMTALFTDWARGEIDKSNAILKGSQHSTTMDKLVVKMRVIGA